MFEIAEPFNSLINKRAIYRVTGINNIIDLEADGLKPYDTIYKPLDLTKTEILDDINKRIPIITLTSEDNRHIYIPADMIISIPKITGHLYQETVITIPLGAIPKSLDLSVLCNDIKAYVKDRIGIISPVKVVPTSSTTLLTETEHHKYEAIRKARVVNKKSYRVKYLETVGLLEKCKFIKEKLEKALLR